jgi:hypothetical protein
VAVLLDPPPTRWVCANGCGISDLTPAGVSNRFHACSALAGILAPLVPEGQRCEVLAVEREDYIGDQIVRRDGNGRPVMAVITVRDEGEDRVVFAPTARTGSGS